VPKELADVYPSIDTTRVSYWGGFADEYRCTFLAPMDPLYAEIQKDFLTVQTEMFGTDHIYGVDPFNEIDAPSWDPQTLAAMSAHIYESMSAVDPEAVWLQMGWLFYADPIHWNQENIEAFLRAVPQDKMILLDYYCEFIEIWKQTKEFYGQPYIWCYLGNFGGNTMMSGNFRTVSSRIEDALANGGDNLIGMGSTLEGFGVNMFMYEYILDRAWNTGMSDDEWISKLADRRLGYADEGVRKAWATLCDDVYTEHSKTGHATLTCAHPALEGNWHWTTKPSMNYSVETLWDVWDALLAAPSDRDSYKYDVVNVGRQVLGDMFMGVRDDFTAAYKSGDLAGMEDNAELMLEIIDDMDRLVSCHAEFSLKDWVDMARSFGNTPEEKDYYETNARTLVSVWGDSYHLSDYASRAWAGMLSTFYKVRWEMFVNEVMDSFKAGVPFDAKAFDARIWEFENKWAKSSHKIEYPQAGDPVAVAKELAQKYR
jgi:alpha-N-acetylglucosaminidase